MSNNSLNKIQAIEKIDNNVVGETRHYPAASKEWSNSIYAYNKNTVKSLPAKDKVANSLLKSYFNFVAVSQNNTKSIRMRNLIRRNSTKKLFVSKPEIKQTNDKVIVTAYTADREKDFLLRKLYFFNKSYKNGAVGMQSPTRYISALKNLFHGASQQETSKRSRINSAALVSTTKKDKTFVENVLPKSSTQSKTSRDMMIKKLGRFSRLHIRNKAKNSGISLFRRKLSKRSGAALKTYTIRKNLFRNRLAISIIKKKNFLKNVFFYSFLKWTLSIFKINIYIHQTLKGGGAINRAKKLIVINKGDYYKVLTIDNNANYSVNFRKINIILFQLLMLTLTRKGFNPSGKPFVNAKSERVSPAAIGIKSASFSLDKLVSFLFRYFKFKYYGKFVQKHLKKEVLALNYLYMLSLNNFKFDRFLPGLKHLISRIYSKKVELNLVNLKYLHLNSDIFSESIAIKLRKKKNSLLRVLRGSLKLVKIPSKQSSASLGQRDLVKQNTHFTESLSNFRPLDNYMALHSEDDFIAAHKVVPNYNETNLAAASDVLHVVLKKMFPNDNIAGAKSGASTLFVKQHNESVLDTSTNVIGALNKEPVTKFGGVSKKMSEILLNSIKYKWITGARIEAKGRLTKRFTASRSLFKFRYKGSLRNVDYSGLNAPSMRSITRKAPSTVMVRGQMKPNLQYTFVSSKKRIGAFGIKGWISSN